MSLNMTRAERDAFLMDLHVGVFSVEVPGAAPLSAPIWYDYDPGVGVWVLTGPTSKKGVALENAGRYTIVAQTETPPYKYVTVSGPVIEVRPSDREKDSRPMARRYLGTEMGDRYTDAGSEDAAGNVYVMRPEQWLTLDYGKM